MSVSEISYLTVLDLWVYYEHVLSRRRRIGHIPRPEILLEFSQSPSVSSGSNHSEGPGIHPTKFWSSLHRPNGSLLDGKEIPPLLSRNKKERGCRFTFVWVPVPLDKRSCGTGKGKVKSEFPVLDGEFGI